MQVQRRSPAALLGLLLPGVSAAKYANALRADQALASPAPASRSRLSLLVLIFTQRRNLARRKAQRATWLGARWLVGEARRESSSQECDWRYVYVLARDEGKTSKTIPDEVKGDMVTLSRAREGYANLVFKTLEAVRWALARVAFDVILKTDDDTVVHVGRLSAWLALRASPKLYAGRLFRDSQIIRSNFSRADLRHPEFFPPDLAKWAVPLAAYSSATGSYPPCASRRP